MVRLNIQLAEKEARKLAQRARATGQSRAAIIRELVETLLKVFADRTFQISTQACRLAGKWMARYHGHDHAVDFLIAGVAEVHGCRLMTGNVRPFPMFKGLKPPY